MFVLKRNGQFQDVHFDKITSRISKLCYGLNTDYVDPVVVAQKVIQGVYKGVPTSELDELAAETAASLITEHPDFSRLAARISVSNLHKSTCKDFLELTTKLFEYIHPATQKKAPLVSEAYYRFVRDNAKQLNSSLVYDRDFMFEYFGFKTLQKSYLLKMHGKTVERPQHMWMRVACALHLNDVERAIETYNLLSQHWYIHASPTLFQAGMPDPQLSSCFLIQNKEDSIEGIYDTLKTCALISKRAGGVGINVSNVRATGSYISGTGGFSNGLIPMLRVFNNSSEYVDQGGGKRKGSIAVYLEVWHADVFAFLDMRRNIGVEDTRCRELFNAIVIPDLFMRHVEQDLDWYLFCPNEAPGLMERYGQEFEDLYLHYASQPHLIRRTVKARDVWASMLRAWSETSVPYVFFKDSSNFKSNQKNVGTLTMSNLCSEIIEFTSPNEAAVCNLASVSLPMFVSVDNKTFNHQKLFEVTKIVTYNMNRVLDITRNPVPEAKTSNERHRPTGIGAQGLADVFLLLKLPFESLEARQLNLEIYETMYYAALVASCELAERDGPYSTFQGSPLSQGLFQFDLWGLEHRNKREKGLLSSDPSRPSASSTFHPSTSSRWDWETLRQRIMKYGVRNSLLIAAMPTASTSQILNNNSCFEPYTSNLYVRRTLAGEFICVSKHLVFSLIERGLWTKSLREKLLAHNGSVQHIAEIPPDLKALHKTAWEIKTKVLLDYAADRGRFICQSQSLNVYLNELDDNMLTAMYFYAWKKGLKTIYYVHTQAAVDAIKFTVPPETEHQAKRRLNADTKQNAADVLEPNLQTKRQRVEEEAEQTTVNDNEVNGDATTESNLEHTSQGDNVILPLNNVILPSPPLPTTNSSSQCPFRPRSSRTEAVCESCSG